MADPSSPVPAPEDTQEALNRLRPHIYECDCAFCANWKAASTEILALVSRLRSQAAELKQALGIDGDAAAHFLATISGLRSQVERMKAERLSPSKRDEESAASCHLIADVLEAEGAHKHIAPAPVHIENLRYAAAHLRCSPLPTPIEAVHLLIEMEQIDARAFDIPGGWVSATLQNALAKLRRLSSDNSENAK